MESLTSAVDPSQPPRIMLPRPHNRFFQTLTSIPSGTFIPYLARLALGERRVVTRYRCLHRSNNAQSPWRLQALSRHWHGPQSPSNIDTPVVHHPVSTLRRRAFFSGCSGELRHVLISLACVIATIRIRPPPRASPSFGATGFP